MMQHSYARKQAHHETEQQALSNSSQFPQPPEMFKKSKHNSTNC
jgi:hypothetical protein